MIFKGIKNKTQLKYINLISFIFIYSVYLYYSTDFKNRRIEAELLKNSSNLEHKYQFITNDFYDDCKYRMKNFLGNNKKMLKIFAKAKNADEKERDILREKLKNHLTPLFKRMKSRGIEHLQLVFNDNTSFLRMHKPSRFGDDLTNYRYALKYANIYKKDIYGFEQGRTVHAFRYTFPVFYKNEHIGVIELSLSTEYVQKELKKYHLYSHFLVDRTTFKNKKFQDSGLYTPYISAIEDKNYLMPLFKDDTVLDKKTESVYKQVVSKLQKKIKYKMEQKKLFSLYTKINDDYMVISFLPIKDVQNQSNSYLVSLSRNKYISHIYFDYMVINLFVFIIMLIVSSFIYLNLKKNIALNLKVNRLKRAEQLVHMGSLEFDIQNKHLSLSDEFYNIMDLEKTKKGIHNEETLFGELEKVLLNADEFLDFYFAHKQNHKYALKTLKLLFKAGTLKYIEMCCETVYGDIASFMICTIHDITEQELLKLEKQNNERIIFDQSKKVALGEMLENIAHQWRQPLSVISVSASGVKMGYETKTLNEDDIVLYMDEIVASTEYLSSTIDDFRNFLRKDKKPENFSIQEAYKISFKLLKSKIKHRDITLIEKIEDLEFKGYQNELIQVFMNLFSNAIDILDEINPSQKFIVIKILKKKNHISIKFQDNGKGIKKGDIKKVFEPYFTTKGENGTGIGLFMSYRIIKSFGGDIKVKNSFFKYDNKKYEGALFIITLPYIQKK